MVRRFNSEAPYADARTGRQEAAESCRVSVTFVCLRLFVVQRRRFRWIERTVPVDKEQENSTHRGRCDVTDFPQVSEEDVCVNCGLFKMCYSELLLFFFEKLCLLMQQSHEVHLQPLIIQL